MVNHSGKAKVKEEFKPLRSEHLPGGGAEFDSESRQFDEAEETSRNTGQENTRLIP